jgi:hypothetical protein
METLTNLYEILCGIIKSLKLDSGIVDNMDLHTEVSLWRHRVRIQSFQLLPYLFAKKKTTTSNW